MKDSNSSAAARRAVLASGLLALAIAVTGTYYALRRNASAPGEVAESGVADSHVAMAAENFNCGIDDYGPIAARFEIVVEGVVQDLLPARWTTPDAKAPPHLTELLSTGGSPQERNTLKYHIRTPVRFAVSRVFKGEGIGDTLTFSFVGGTVGDITQTMAGAAQMYRPGSRLILFLRKGPADGPAARVHPDALAPSVPLIVDGDVVHGPNKDAPLAEVVRQIEQGAGGSFEASGTGEQGDALTGAPTPADASVAPTAAPTPVQ